MELRHEIVCALNAIMQFGSASNVITLEIFMLTEIVQRGTRVGATL